MLTKHGRIYNTLLQRIRSGVYASHTRLPNEKQLAAEFDVSVGTLTHALETLVQEGILTRRRGSGTYINALPEKKVDEPRVIFVLTSATDINSHAYLQPIFTALSESTAQQGVSFEIAVVPHDHWLELPQRFPGSGFYFVSPVIESLPVLTALWECRPCFVVVGASWETPVPFPTVDCDNRRGAQRAVEYLLHLGHRRIALVNGEDSSANCRDRRNGYRDALHLWDIPEQPGWLIPAGSSTELSAQAKNRLVDLLLSRQGPTAVFCAGYYLALEVIDVARRLDVVLPAHLSLIAVDDPKSAQFLQPPLSTLCQPLAEIGTRGAARLLSLLRDAAPGSSPSGHSLSGPVAPELLPAELILRGSCALPREPLSPAEPAHAAFAGAAPPTAIT